MLCCMLKTCHCVQSQIRGHPSIHERCNKIHITHLIGSYCKKYFPRATPSGNILQYDPIKCVITVKSGISTTRNDAVIRSASKNKKNHFPLSGRHGGGNSTTVEEVSVPVSLS